MQELLSQTLKKINPFMTHICQLTYASHFNECYHVTILSHGAT